MERDGSASGDYGEPGVTLKRLNLAHAASVGLISPVQADALWAAWSLDPALGASAVHDAAPSAGPSFGLTNVLYYFGGMLAIGSMSFFMTLGWASLGSGGLLAITLANIALCLLGARRLEHQHLPVPAGILATLAIVLVPLATWCGQHLLGLWPPGSSFHSFSDYHEYIDGRWLSLEAATLVAAITMLLRHRHPFMVMPIAVTLWYVSMDLASFIVQRNPVGRDDEWAVYKSVSLAFGLGMCLAATWIDLRLRLAGSRKDFAFWLYVFGTPTFWSALSLSGSGSTLGKLAYCAINVSMVFFGAAIGRRVLTVFGGIGVTAYLGDLAYRVFGYDNLMFPFTLLALGLALVGFGIWWQRHEAAIQIRLGALLPAGLKGLASGCA